MANVLFGRKPLLENLTSNNIANVDLSKNNRDLISSLKKYNIQYQLRDDNFFNKYDKKLNHQGIVITLKESNKINDLKTFFDIAKTKSQSIVLVIDSIQDPQNFGSILRTCDTMGVDAVIYKKDNQVQINDFVSKSSMGAIQYLNLIKVTNLSNALEEFKNNGYWIYTSALLDKSIDYDKVKYENKCVLIVGSEENGVSSIIINRSDFLIKIPMQGKIKSLNVAVATGILLSKINSQFN
jgi:23S rRNA (guanosine2251-2'-O)-methyltransferase